MNNYGINLDDLIDQLKWIRKEVFRMEGENIELKAEAGRNLEVFLRECKIRAGLPDDGLVPPLLDWINRARKALEERKK